MTDTAASSARPEAGASADEDKQKFVAQLRQFIGRSSPASVPRDPVNVAMIRHWTDAMGDDNPVYIDEAAGKASPYGTVVSPPVMLDVWDCAGLKQQRDPNNPQAAVLTFLDANGFTSVVAVNSEMTFAKPIRPGMELSSVLTLDDVSEEKATALGVGHFVTSRYRYTDQHGEHVGDFFFRVLKFRPGTGKQIPADPNRPAAPDATPSKRPRPGINLDNRPFWDGARAHELKVQRCRSCGEAQFPPLPACRECTSSDLEWIACSGKGTLYSFAVPHHPQAPGFRYPVIVGLVELEEGARLVTNVVDVARDQLRIGMPLEVCWLDSHPAMVEGEWDSRGSITLPQFRPVAPARRENTLTAADIAVGHELPLFPIPLTPTLIVSAALATRDYATVHHDRDFAQKAGSQDLFMNIRTTLGLVQRYLDDWAGPHAATAKVGIRLGVPNYPYDTMTLSGKVTAIDAATGRVTVAFRGTNQLGDHATGTAELLLPGGSDFDAFVRG